jgi:LmbE family N-acetylglucosaminyl deacetylase
MPGDRGPGSTEAEITARQRAIAELETCDVLGVFAHPDDETFASGTFAQLAQNGKRVLLVYATSGDAGGDLTGRGLSGPALGEEREREMRSAAEVLGLSAPPLFLRYPDGNVYDYWDELVDMVRSIIERTDPSVVVTFGPDGYYGHADHVAVGQIAGRAVDASDGPSHLLHAAISRSRNNMIAQMGGGTGFKSVADAFITYTVDVRAQLEKRTGAMAMHRTQFDEQTLTRYRLLAALTGTEQFVEARHPGEAGALADLLAVEASNTAPSSVPPPGNGMAP